MREFVGTQMQVLLSKSRDYATDDVLSNFKLAGAISGISAERNCLSLIATQVARLGVLLSAVDPPANESITDTLMDLANYSILLHALTQDKP